MLLETQSQPSFSLPTTSLAPDQIWECDLCHRNVSPATATLTTASSSDRPWEVMARASLDSEKAHSLYRRRLMEEAKASLEKFLEDYSDSLVGHLLLPSLGRAHLFSSLLCMVVLTERTKNEWRNWLTTQP